MESINYSSLFSCLYNETQPVENLGRGTHYSILRSIERVNQATANLPQVHDVAVIWDEDHDTRVIGVIERIYKEDLLSPIQFIGERKGMLTAIVSAEFYFSQKKTEIKSYVKQLEKMCTNLSNGDEWAVNIGRFERSVEAPDKTEVTGLINDYSDRVIEYLRKIDARWQLGTKNHVSRFRITR